MSIKIAVLPLLLVAAMTGTARLSAQSPAKSTNAQNPAGSQQQPAPKSDPNAFPEDTSTVPVIPTTATPASINKDADAANTIAFPAADRDPARSPEDTAEDVVSTQGGESSSSFSGMDRLLPSPDVDAKVKPKKQPTAQESAAQNIEVGSYYLDRKNWKAALSRYQSALVLDPENPDVYWGLGEAERHLGNFADARAYYRQLLDYDPDGPHGKQARKLLKDPSLADVGLPVSARGTDTPK
jgi:tetratricopeptide (TPR) repeat protein